MNESEQAHTETRTVPLGPAQAVDAKIRMGWGKARVAGGAEALLEAAFTYSEPAWQPEISYTDTDERGELVVRQPDEHRLGTRLCDAQYEWDLRFNNRVALALDIKLGAGDANLELGDLSLTRLVTRVGSGDIRAALPNGSDALEEITLHAASGNVTLELAGEHAALRRIRIETASGKIALTAHGDFPALTEVVITSASGDVAIEADGTFAALAKTHLKNVSGKLRGELAGCYPALTALGMTTVSGKAELVLPGDYPVLERLDFNGVSGLLKAQLTGAFAPALTGNLKLTSGCFDVGVPATRNVSAKSVSISGNVNAPGFTHEGNHYIHRATEDAETMAFDIKSVSGNVELRLLA